MKLRCRICQAELTLNPDSQDARNAGTDPRQQLRRHIVLHAFEPQIVQIGRRSGWLIDLLCFEPVDEPEKWRRWLEQTIDWLVKEVTSHEASGGYPMQPYEVNGDLGSCCACGTTGPTVRNILMLDFRIPAQYRDRRGLGCWGCMVCGLAVEGAVAVLCDQCLAQKREVRWVVVGVPAHNQRIPRSELTEPYHHDEIRHSTFENRALRFSYGCRN